MADHLKSTSKAGIDYFDTDYLKDGLKKRALRESTVSLVVEFSVFIIQMIGTIILARLLTPNDYGLVTMAVTVGLLLGNFGGTGFTEAIIQAKELNHRQISTLFWINVVIAVVLALVFIAFSFVVVWFFKEPRLNNIIIVIALSNVFTGLSVQHLALIKRNIQYSKISVNELIATIIGIGIPILMAFRGWGYWALVAKWLVTPLVVTIGAWIICRWRPGLPARGTGVMPLIRYALHTYGNFVVGYFRKNMPNFLIGRYFGSQALGHYDRGFHLTMVLPNQLIMPLYGPAISTFSRIVDDPERYRRNFLQVISTLAFISMPLSAAICLISHDVVLMLLGPQWHETGPIFFVLGLSVGVIVIYISHSWLHFSLGTPDRLFRWSILELIVTFSGYLIGLSYGTLGIATAYSAIFYILVGPAFWYAGKPIGLKVFSVFSHVWKFFASALAAGICSWFILHSYDFTSNIFNELHVFVRIVTAAGLCLAFYLVIIVILCRGIAPISQFAGLIREIIKK